ncbi:hypothetical protein ACSBR1_019305 [Camellia fascicularis]
MEVDGGMKREKMEGLVRELMEGEKGKEMRRKAMEWKKRAREAIRLGRSSYVNFDKFESAHGWKGSAATSAFRPASSHKILEADKTLTIGGSLNSLVP